MKLNIKRIAALAGAIILVGLFITAIVMAITGAPREYLMAVIFSIVFITVVFYAMQLMLKALKGPGKNDIHNGREDCGNKRDEKGTKHT